MTVAQWNVSQNQFPANVQTKDVGNVSAAVLDAIVRALQLDGWVTPCIPTATSLTATPRSPDLGDLKAKPTDRAQAQNGGSARSRPAFFSCWARHWRRRTQVLGNLQAPGGSLSRPGHEYVHCGRGTPLALVLCRRALMADPRR
jgi:hypothetical protein